MYSTWRAKNIYIAFRGIGERERMREKKNNYRKLILTSDGNGEILLMDFFSHTFHFAP